jgi:hypothetical protein
MVDGGLKGFESQSSVVEKGGGCLAEKSFVLRGEEFPRQMKHKMGISG